jgi:hypothetical protein
MTEVRDFVWYLECRPFKTEPNFAPVASSMGSAVAVKLKTNTGETKKYLLTCGHVVRQPLDSADKDGWGKRFEEIYCFPPNEAYVHTTEGSRRSGQHPRGMLADLHPSSPFGPDAVPVTDRLATNDWAFLEVRDGRFQNYPAVILGGTITQNLLLQIVGFPGGAGSKDAPTWATGIVQSVAPAGFKQTRLPAQGMLLLDGPDETQKGMSGGGVFSSVSMELLGLHRGADDRVLARHALAINLIRERLQDLGFSTDLAPANNSAPSPTAAAQEEPCEALLAGKFPAIPVINRAKLRDNLQKISDPQSEFRAVSLTGPTGSGKSWSQHLVKHVAKSKEMPMALLDLSGGQNMVQACRRIARDMKLDVKDMASRVLEDEATRETVGQKFAYWLVDTTMPENRNGKRSILMVDQVHTSDGAFSPLYEQLVLPIAEELKAVSDAPGLVMILAGAPFTSTSAQRLFVLDEQVEPLTDRDVADFIYNYAASINRKLSTTEHAQFLLHVTGGATGSFDAARMQAVTRAVIFILENPPMRPTS